MKKILVTAGIAAIIIIIIIIIIKKSYTEPDTSQTKPVSSDTSGKKTESKVEIQGVKAEDGILVFNTLEDFSKGYEEINNMDLDNSIEWEKKIKFESQRNTFTNVVKAEYDIYLRPYEKLSDEELKSASPPKGHSEEYKRALSQGVIKLVEDKSDTTYNYSIVDGSYAPVINKDGIFVVSDTIYQIKGNLFKEVAGYNKKNLALIGGLDTIDRAAGIKVFNISTRAVTASCPPSPSGWRYSPDGRKRGATTMYYSHTFYWPYPYRRVDVRYSINVQAQTRNFWGRWNYDGGDCYISGNWTYKIDVINTSNLSYGGTYTYSPSYNYPYHPNSINNFWASLSPLTGASPPYPSYYTLTAPTGKAFSFLRFTEVHWYVLVPGGTSGISCNIGCP